MLQVIRIYSDMRGCVPAACPTPPGKEKVLFLREHPKAPGPSAGSGQAAGLRPLHPRV